MLLLIVLLFVLFLILGLVLAAWTLFYQGYIYTEPATGVLWRGPAAGAATTAFISLWVIMSYQSPGAFRPLHDMESTEDYPPFPELRVVGRQGQEEVYKLLRASQTRYEYRQEGRIDGKLLPSRPDKVTVVEELRLTPAGKDQEEVYRLVRVQGRFEYRRDGRPEGAVLPSVSDRGKVVDGQRSVFLRQPETKPSSWSLNKASEPLVYRDEKGRNMTENTLGQVTVFHGGRLIVSLVLNVLCLAVLFVSFWLLLRFHWPSALLQSLVAWLILGLFVVPPILTRADRVAEERATRSVPSTPTEGSSGTSETDGKPQ